ncbi:MAG: 2Fe-2S iron-sulfur cluster-binding protein, partial [Terracidiphilus sp.]
MSADHPVSDLVRIRLEPLAVELDVPRGSSLVAALAARGVEFPCGGTGECGGCGVRLLSGSLPAAEADSGVFTAE